METKNSIGHLVQHRTTKLDHVESIRMRPLIVVLQKQTTLNQLSRLEDLVSVCPLWTHFHLLQHWLFFYPPEWIPVILSFVENSSTKLNHYCWVSSARTGYVLTGNHAFKKCNGIITSLSPSPPEKKYSKRLTICITKTLHKLTLKDNSSSNSPSKSNKALAFGVSLRTFFTGWGTRTKGSQTKNYLELCEDHRSEGVST